MLLYLLDSAMPNLNAIRAVVDGADLEILRLLAEFSPFAASLPDLKSKMAPLIKLLIVSVFIALWPIIACMIQDTMPLPPSEQNGGSSSATNGDDEHAQMKISEIEALLYILHQFGKHDSSTLVALLTNDENKELRKRSVISLCLHCDIALPLQDAISRATRAGLFHEDEDCLGESAEE